MSELPADEASAYVALGSNLGDRLATLRSASRALAAGAVPGARLVRASPIFETHPLGPADGPFLNAVVELRGVIDPELTLAALLEIEARHGRIRRERWGPRTLDLDLLAVLRGGESQIWSSDRLTLPHPELARRDFVLEPLAALAPGVRPTGGASVEALLAGLTPAQRTIFARSDAPLC
ncbi:MAG: 2-amino-4-hydroxy-6-hydroxymethyldihydropteridine diphosphokinase [Myxococcales bacterium]|nr:2-amino-4-hydroxy-6-hydroxymethyldihydropteridine diphosphokinase [Myxococcales bacterium]MCB9704449.1 2-amino-4-hydroxy-6-hydroxymethyldihydropteridine diphosphokinase [Myxococcales bacterium]